MTDVVLYLDHCARDSGAELALCRTAGALRRYTPVVVLGEDGPLVGRLARAGVATQVLPLPSRTRNASRQRVGALTAVLPRAVDVLRYAWRLRATVLEHDACIIHTNSMKAHVYGAVAAVLARRPMVAHVRDRVSTDFMSAAGVRLIRGVLVLFPSAVVANSRATAMTVPARTLRRCPVLVLPSPVDQPTMSARQRPAAEGLVYGIVGRITPWKGQDLVLRAFAAAFPGEDSAHRLLVVGAPQFGEEDYLDELRALVGELGLGGRVEFTGHVQDVYEQMARMQVLVHGSVIPEPFGQVVVQGMAVGLAVIAAGEGGPAETITHGVDGVLYEPRSSTGLTAALRTVGADDILRKRLAAAAVVTAQQYMTEPVTSLLEDFYDRCALRWRSGPR
jgi:glycosyltransferase involved in cell wall biosynthesis